MKKKHVVPRFKQEKFILTNEPWYPTKADGTVRVFLTSLGPNGDMGFRVGVWGEDDFGLERDFEKKSEAKRWFDYIVNLTTQAQLRAWGFAQG